MYARWVLTPLRRFAHVTEQYMSARRWDAVPYRRVPSKCMAANASVFIKHDEARFSAYLRDVAAGSVNISGATLLPHELLVTLGGCVTDTEKQVVEAQWDAMVQNVRNSGALDNCLAVCDTSGSMGIFAQDDSAPRSPTEAIRMRRERQRQLQGERPDPIYPALALSLVLAQTAREPWNNCFITFSETPTLQHVDPSKGLAAMTREMNASGAWGLNTDYNAIFTKLILPVAVKNRLKPEDMIKRLFVFSDMEFDNSRSGGSEWSTEHEIIRRRFEAAGYTMPEIVYWNLQGGGVPRPVDKDTEGAALVTGFSPNMLKMFMAGEIIVPDVPASTPTAQKPDGTPRTPRPRTDPLALMQATLGRPSFSGLRVAD
ncbi:hypothetical protein AURDEDRAFT_114880 [Auricularia subglabra TFB-10046 SS5]|nr:hypothetical protein AURDEDRAFT_114880 [Auricularia subglabra TFB-10046 SS5]